MDVTTDRFRNLDLRPFIFFKIKVAVVLVCAASCQTGDGVGVRASPPPACQLRNAKSSSIVPGSSKNPPKTSC